MNSLEAFPHERFETHVEAFVAFYGATNGYLEQISEIKSDEREVESLRDVVEACIGAPVTRAHIESAVDVLAGIYEKS